MVREQADSDESPAPGTGRRSTAVRLDAAALQSEAAAAPAAASAPAAAPRATAARGRGKFVIRDLDAEEIVPGFSKLSVKEPEPGGAGRDREGEEGPVASRTRAREKETGAAAAGGAARPGARGTPAPKAPGRKSAGGASPSPTLSRYGVALGASRGLGRWMGASHRIDALLRMGLGRSHAWRPKHLCSP